MKKLSIARRSLRRLGLLALPTMLVVAAAEPAVAAVDLADKPLFSTVTVPGNMVLALSVEYPTASTPAYFSTPQYASTTTYQGYFDPAKCYKYAYDSTTPSNSYFAPYGAATNQKCTSSANTPLWSGNYLNWSSMQSLDIFRWVLTGGNRTVDTSTSTILQKTYFGPDGGSYTPNKVLPSSEAAGATPFDGTYDVNTRIAMLGTQMYITGSGSLTTTSPTDYQTQNSKDSPVTSSNSKVYNLYINVKVCDSTKGLESNCVAHGTSNKPEGLMQQYSSKLRYSAFGYLNDNDVKRDGGVLRAAMNYIGPMAPVPGSASITNSAAEWNDSDGTMIANPDSSDAAATSTASSVTISQSGVMNYLNKFGYASQKYKTYDPVSEMYYAAIRYLKNQGNVPEYTNLGSASASTKTTMLDGFPVITSWADPIKYSCQKNFILGIGDVNTHRDENVPGSTLYTATDEPAVPASVTADTTVNVKTATDMVGKLEGLANLGTTYVSTGRYDTNFIAGLAYDSHTKDIRSDLTGTQTVNTYWLDVLEGQTYVKNNEYYLATKYGGFTVPAGFQPYASTNGTSTLTDSMWHNNTDTEGSGSSPNKRPDNYFTANIPQAMRDGLTAAFAKITSEADAADSTAFSSPTPNVANTGSVSYAASYDPSTWTGNVVASTVAYAAADGTPTLTAQWDARAKLDAQTTRYIVTCCTAGGAGMPFQTSNLTGSVNGRVNYTSFGAVTGASSQNAANYLAYLRGDRTKEIANGGAYRTRSHVLGDIVNSKPTPVGPPSSPFYDSANPGYSSFKTSNASRTTVVYVGANDGMMHAFNGSTAAGSSGGKELFAYIPSFLYGTSTTAATSGLASIGSPSFVHHYFVDSTPLVFDVDFFKAPSPTASAPDWHSVLIGGLGKGGNGYYAIDVTTPGNWTSESNVASNVLWEFTDSTMGLSYGAPAIVKTKKYGWVAVMTSGYNNSDGVGYFYFVNPRDGSLLEKVSTPAGSTSAPINLGDFTYYVADYTDGTADSIYGVDLRGDVWRIDLTTTTGNYAQPTKIAQLTDANSNGQPISSAPLIEVDSATQKRYLMVGTGKLLADSDIASADVQSFYAIADGTGTFGGFYTSSTLPGGISFPVTRSNLNDDTSLLSGIGSSPSSVMGWYFDLPVTNNVAQRVNVDPISNLGIVSFIGNLPNGSACSPAGKGTLYGVSFATGKSVLLDVNGNLVASTSPIDGVLTDLAIMRVNGVLRLYTGGSTGEVVTAPANLNTAGGVKQLNWRDIPLAN